MYNNKLIQTKMVNIYIIDPVSIQHGYQQNYTKNSMLL